MSTDTARPYPFQAFAADVAHALGAGWSVASPAADGFAEQRATRARLVARDGVALVLRNGWEGDGRLSAYPDWQGLDKFARETYDGSRWHKPTNLQITMSASKSAEQVARDLARRLLAPMLPVWMDLQAKKAEADAYDARTADLQADIIARLGALAYQPMNGPKPTDGFRLSVTRGGGLYGDVEVNGDAVTMHLRSLPADVARDIADLLAARFNARKEG